jgi:pimeloyl-ACP methyl ester carboxylesterase
MIMSFISKSTAWMLMAVSSLAVAHAGKTAAGETGYAPVDGLELYYEMQGSGKPLILLHGGLGSADMFREILPSLAKNRRVIALDLQAHGRTADIDRPLSYQAMADDVAALIRYLKLDKADVMGYSMGGEVALRTAIQHPGEVRKLVLVSAAFRRDGWYPEILAQMARMGSAGSETFEQTPMHKSYEQIAPRPQDWPTLVGKLGEMFRKDYDWSRDVREIKAPVLLVFGDADAVRTEHAVQFFELLGGGQKDGGWDGSGMSRARLAILPGVTHYTMISPELVSTVVAFLDSPTP